MWKAPGANQIQSQDLARRRRFHPPSVQNLKHVRQSSAYILIIS